MLPLNNKFLRDIQGNNTNLYPLIVINDEYYISTVKESIKDDNNILDFKDYNLKISNIKESIDIKNHNFKISNVTLTLSNYELDGVRLSDTLNEKINTFATIYYKSQSCLVLDDCLQVYRGQVRRFEHDDKTVKLTLEDITESVLHKDVPITNLGTDNCYSKDFLNRYIPITYGYVEKAPAIPYLYGSINNNTGERSVSIISDDVSDITENDRGIEITGFGTKEGLPEDFHLIDGDNPLYIYKGGYQKVLENCDSLKINEPEIFYAKPEQYTVDGGKNFISLIKTYSGQYAQNPTAFNELQTVKIRFPNEMKLLYEVDGDSPLIDINNFEVINAEPHTGIFNPEGAYDNPNVQYSNILQTTNHNSTFAQIPNSSVNQDSLDLGSDWQLVHEFTPFNNSNNYQVGIRYLHNRWSQYYKWWKTPYLYNINAWCQTNAAHLDIQFIDMPSGEALYNKVNERLAVDNYSVNNTNIINTSSLNLIREWEIHDDFASKWQEASGLTGEETLVVNTGEAGQEGIPHFCDMYFPTPDGENANSQGWGEYGGSHSDYKYWDDFKYKIPSAKDYPTFNYIDSQKDLFSGRLSNGGAGGAVYYPQCVSKFLCNASLGQNTQNISYIIIGMYDATTMPAVSGGVMIDSDGENFLWYNMFPDETDPDSIPYLYEWNDRCIYDPQAETSRLQGNDIYLAVEYEALWNGTSIKTTNGSNINYSNKYYYGSDFSHDSSHSLSQGSFAPTEKEMASNSNNGSPTGGASWFIRATDTIAEGAVLRQVNGTDGDVYGYNDENCRTVIRKNTLMPCNYRMIYSYTSSSNPVLQSYDMGHDFLLLDSIESLSLTVGDEDTAERRLGLLFPIEPSGFEDAIDTSTFVLGKIDCAFYNPNTNEDDSFEIIAAATDILDNDTNFNAEESLSETALVKIAGDGENINTIGNVKWSSFNIDQNDGTSNLDNVFDFNNIKIGAWDKPDKFDALSLIYRLRGDSITHNIQIKTEIFQVSLLQYTIFENALNNEFYLDTIGRADLPEDGFKYTGVGGNPKSVIQNPADVIYHFLEKELQSVDKMNIESLIESRTNNNNIDVAFSVKDKINSKKLIENISKNSMLYPKYNSYGIFSFANIKSIYNESDYEIKSKDIVSYSFKRTPIEDIITLANVKFKKDYAEDEYLKSTGYCDAYDFFGNGDLNGLIKQNGNIVDGYKYSYFGIKREHKILEFESDYIRDLQSANALRNYLFLQNCNQHTLISLTLPIKYMFLESGDVLSFDSLINNLKAYGEDYTSNEITRNGQVIYPYFIVTSITKSTKNIKIECMQLHKLTSEADFSNCKGSLSRSSEFGIEAEDAISHINVHDLNEFYDFLQSKSKYFTTLQKKIADIHLNGVIDTYDLNLIEIALGYATGQLTDYGSEPTIFGDVNNDGIVNVVDVVAIVSYILGSSTEISDFADMNLDGIVNVVDVVAVVNDILGDN